MSYTTVNVRLSAGQKDKLIRSMEKSAPIVLRISASDTSGNDKLIVTQTQARRIQKARASGTGVDVKLSQTGIRKQTGAGWASFLKPLAGDSLKDVAGKALDYGMTKLSGGGAVMRVPQSKINKIIRYKDYLTPTQKKQLLGALQTGNDIRSFKITKGQMGSGFGGILASILLPTILNSVSGRGLGRETGRNVYVPKSGKGLGRASGRNIYVPKKTGKGLIFGKNKGPFKGIPILETLF